jgi:restriction system-associated AAA family ATPase
MKLLSLEIGEQFRSLHPGFKVNFHQLNKEGLEAMLEFRPFCFAGLNGSGKSNVLEALAAIFYHLEMCVAKYRPDSFEKHFKRDTCTPNAFTLKYMIGEPNQAGQVSRIDNLKYLARLVTITKQVGQEPLMKVDPNPFKIDNLRGDEREVSLLSTDMSKESAAGKKFLPDLVVGYSSGENEILSLPFIKNRLVHFDEYKEAVKKGFPFSEPETSLLYIDEEMSQAVLLACMLYEDPKTTLKPLRDELGIVGIRSFRMNLNMQGLAMDEEKTEHKPILQHVYKTVDALKRCATSWYETDYSKSKKSRPKSNPNLFSVLTLDFFVNDKTKQVFRDHFKSSFELFRFFQVLYELNANIIGADTKEEVYKSRGFYTDGKLPVAGPEDCVFYFLDYMILKDEGGDKPNERLLREFSDGEHQFLHTMGICLLLKERRTLLLLDEPETHFNPSWRAKFIKVLKDSLKAGYAINFLKDVFLTSHSPFIISDCMPDNVILFEKNELGRVEARKASELGIDTYGTSVNILTNRIFKSKDTIGKYVLSKLNEFRERFQTDENKEEIIEDINEEFGDSIEKLLLIKEFSGKEK